MKHQNQREIEDCLTKYDWLYENIMSALFTVSGTICT